MEFLIVVRHGSHDEGEECLSETGTFQMKALAGLLRLYVEGGMVGMVSSTSPLATESADILCSELGITGYDISDVLWSSHRRPIDPMAAAELVRRKAGNEVVIVVSHMEYAERFPAFYVQKIMRKNASLIPLTVGRGHALVLNCSAATAEVIPG